MKYTFTRWLATLGVLLMTAGPLTASAEEGQIYTVKKGDTLWDISSRFIDDPYYWPNVWANNPEITNPHLIFPGQKIRIIDGRLEIIPAYTEKGQTPTLTDDGLPVSVDSEHQSFKINGSGSGDGFILTTEDSLGMVVDSVDNRTLLTENDLVFVKMKDPSQVTIGDSYSIFERSEEILDPQSEQPLGTMMHNLGYIQVTGITGETITAKILKTYREVERGAELFEYKPLVDEIVMTKSKATESGLIVAGREKKATLSSGDVIYINLGVEEGVDNGNLFYISRPRHVSDKLIKQAGTLELPDEVLGAAIVIDARDHTSSAIIFKSVNAAYVGDRVTMAGEESQ
jgi:LysM repeat protein